MIDRDHAGRAIWHEHGNQEGAHTTRAFGVVSNDRILQRLDPANRRGNQHTNSARIRFRDFQARILQRLFCSRNTQLFKAVASARLFRVHVAIRLKSFDLRCKMDIQWRRVKQSDRPHARNTVDRILPAFLNS